MTTFDAVTTYAARHWESHARRCVESFLEMWSDVPLIRYDDADLEAGSTWLRAFKARHAALPTQNFRFDAVRFSHKVAALELAFAAGSADVMVWLDADCYTHAPVDAEWLGALLGDADFGYLRRASKYPECGFMLIRRSAAGAALVRRVVDLYRTDALFSLREWHDSWVIDHVRRQMEDARELRVVSLSGGAEASGHPLVNGPLGARIDHLKGARKAEGRSRRSDLTRPRAESYWR